MTLGFVALGLMAGGGAYALDRLAVAVIRAVPRPPDRSVSDLGLDHEDLTLRSGSHELRAWLLRGGDDADSRPLVLMAHGWSASYGTVLALGRPLVEAGYDVLLFDVRGHGRNEPVPFVTVRHFRDDVAAAAAYAEERFPGRPLVVIGHSLGAAGAVVALAEGVPAVGLVLIASPADVIRVTAEFLVDRGLPGHVLVKILRPFWWPRLGGTFRPFAPARRIGELDMPLLLIQPENDQRVARYHADRLSAAAGVPYHVIPGCEHTDVLAAPRTASLVLDFLGGLPSVLPG